MPLELSSMGIRVDEEALERQLKAAKCEDRKELDYHKALLNGRITIYNWWRNWSVKNMYVFLTKSSYRRSTSWSMATGDD